MKKPMPILQAAPLAAVIAGIILLLSVFFSVRLLLACAGAGLIYWGITRCKR